MAKELPFNAAMNSPSALALVGGVLLLVGFLIRPLVRWVSKSRAGQGNDGPGS